jgi:hypothetical protein
MKELTQEIFIGQLIEVDFACVDYDGLLHIGKAINPRYTWASERWRGFEEIGEPVANSGYKPLTSIKRGEQPVIISSKGSYEKEQPFAKLANETIYNNTHEEERADRERENFYCVHCLAMTKFECVCGENDEE